MLPCCRAGWGVRRGFHRRGRVIGFGSSARGGGVRPAVMARIRDPGVVLGHLLSVLCCWSGLLRP
jgi:hypothetical protein